MNIDFNKLRWPYREDAAFSIVSFIVFTVPLAFAVFTNENFETIKFVIWLVFFGVALLLWVWKKNKGFAGPKRLFRANIAIAPIVGYLLAGIAGWALLSAVFAPDKIYSFFGFYYRFTNGFLFMALWVFSLAVLIDILDKDKWIFLLKILCVDTALVAAKSIAEALGFTVYLGPSIQAFFREAPSFLGNPNFSSMFMACLAPFILVFLSGAKKIGERIFYVVCMFAVLFALVILASRGALIALGVGVCAGLILLSLVTAKKAAFLKISVGILSVLALALLVVKISRPSTFLFNSSDNNINYRLTVWSQSLRATASHPLVGVGLGNFALFHERIQRPEAMGAFDDPHNLWIFLAVSGGVPFLLLFLTLVLVITYRALALFRRTGDYLLLGGLSSLVIFSVAALFTPVPIPCFLILAVLLAGMAKLVSPTARVSLAPVGSWAPMVAGVVFIICGLSLGVGETALHFGYTAFGAGDQHLALRMLRLSRAANPAGNLAPVFIAQSEIQSHYDPEGIMKEIEKYKTLHPAQANTYVAAANAELNLYTSTKNKKYLDGAIADLAASLSIDPYYPERYGELGFYYFLKQDYPEALTYLRRSVDAKPGLLPSLMIEARIYQLQSNRPQFLEVLEQAYKFNLDNPQVKFLWYTAKRQPDIGKVPLNIMYSQR